MESARRVSVRRWESEALAEPSADFAAAEEPLEIRIRGRSVAVTMRSPGHDADLAAGFLFTENIIQHPGDITEISPCQHAEALDHGNILNVFLKPTVDVDFDQLTRHVFASSSCGLCGKASIENVHLDHPPIDHDLSITAETLTDLPHRLQDAQATFAKTGGLHAAGLFNTDGELLACREDVGRHNAVDKVIGHGLMNAIAMNRTILFISGRASFEIMQKALAARISIIAAVSAPSSLAVGFAIESRQTLAAFVRGNRFNIYSEDQRIT